MKAFILSIALMCCYFLGNCQKISSLGTVNESKLGRCTGSAYCSACKNCSRCAHCGSGGTCGVCSPVESQTPLYSSPRKKASSYKPRSSASGQQKKQSFSAEKSNMKSYVSESLSAVKLKEISLRSGPGLSYPVIETLKRNQKVKLLAKKGEWVKVKVLSSGTTGYCNLAGIN
jgi:hypothetical protein